MALEEQLAQGTPEYERVVSIAIRPDGTFVVFDELTGPEARQEFDNVADALGAAQQLLGGGEDEAGLDAKSAQDYWNELAAKKDAARAL